MRLFAAKKRRDRHQVECLASAFSGKYVEQYLWTHCYLLDFLERFFMKNLLKMASLGAAVFLGGFLHAEDRRPMMPNYMPELGETFYSMSYSRSNGDSRSDAIGTGISISTPRTSASASSAYFQVRHRLNDLIEISLGYGYLIESKLNGIEEAAGWANVGLGARYYYLINRDEVGSFSGFISSNKRSPSLSGRDVGGLLSFSYARKFNDQYWLGMGLGRNISSSNYGDSYNIGLGASRVFGDIATSIGVDFLAQDSYDAGAGAIVKSGVSPSIKLSFSGRIGVDSYWVISFSRSKAGSKVYEASGAGYIKTASSSNNIAISFLSKF